MTTSADLTRRLDNLIRLGTVSAVDPDGVRCRVKTGELETDWLRWFAERAGEDRDWNPPSVGEQCMILSPGGDPACGIVLLGINSTANPAPDNSLTRRRTTYRDGAVIEYDTASHILKATLPGGGKAELTAPGGALIKGDVTVDGLITVSKDVLAGPAGISLVTHVHGGVQSGNSTTAVPQ